MKGVLLHGALALFGLLFAFQTWTREPEGDEEETSQVIIAECSPQAVQKLSIDTPTRHVLVEPERDKHGDSFWITTQRKAADKAADKPTDEPSPKPEETSKPEELAPKRFLANAELGDYLKRLSPVRARRALGQLPKDKLEDFGFTDTKTRISLTCAGKTLELDVGARTYGTGLRYVREVKTQAAYLVDDSVVSDLQDAQYKFMQTDLHAFKMEDVGEATLSAQGATKKLLHRDRKREDRATWVDEHAQTKRNEAYANWFARLSRLRARDFLAEGREPGSELGPTVGEISPVLRIEYATDGKPMGKLEIVRLQAGEQAKYYARTETTKVWVTLMDSSAKEIEQDVGLIVSADDSPAPAPAH